MLDTEKNEARPLPHYRRESRVLRAISSIEEEDVRSRYREEAADNNVTPELTPGTSSSEEEREIVAWEPDDPENPYNWGGRKKWFVVFTAMITVINSTMGSSLPSNATPYFTKEWNITSETEKVLPISMFLIGYIFGPIIWGPLSEQFGRKWITTSTFVMFSIWTLACALAPNWPAFLVFRLFVGAFASAPIAVVAGTVADIYGDPQTRGRAMAAFMATTTFGPLFSPIISGFCPPTIGWRWTFWIGLIYAGVSMIPLAFLPETYGPVLLVHRARAFRKRGKINVVAQHELEKHDLNSIVTRVLARPLLMIGTEPIVTATSGYLALVYSIFYMTFQAYPIVYEDLYGLSAGAEGLTFLTIGAGALCAFPIFLGWDAYLRKAQREGRPWTNREEYRRLPLACLGGPSFVVSLFWLGWTARSSIPFWVPMLSGIPFGLGYMLVFMALLNYLVDAYGVYAASANAAASCARSIVATVLPFAATPMFRRLGISGACSLLGALSCIMCVVPFVFIWKGQWLRDHSEMCQDLKRAQDGLEAKMEAKKQREAERQCQLERSRSILGQETGPFGSACGTFEEERLGCYGRAGKV